MPYLGMTKTYSDVLEKISFGFSIIYNIEAFIKIVGLRCRYFQEGWNIMDLFIVVSSNIGFILSRYTDLQVTGMIPVVRALRVARILKLARGASGLKVLI